LDQLPTLDAAFLAMALSAGSGAQTLSLDDTIDAALHSNQSAKNARLETQHSEPAEHVQAQPAISE